ncbi:MAG: acyl dehydratase [Dehalococcoidia bacterium]|nr:MAG: acyl dehydratase [Dehalococcoidia bacterium]
MVDLGFELKAGVSLPELKRKVTQADINLYARASGDYNPIHIDPEFAKKTPLGGTIAHGMLILGYVSEMLTGAFGMDWLESGKLDVRFKAPARPENTVTVSGKITAVGDGNGAKLVKIDIECHNQNNETVITGEASVMVK